jgi:hypothetical protein
MRALQLIGSALWRVQAAHLAVFAVLPALALLLRVALGLVLLPFVVSGFGQRELALGAEVAHLRQPGCWVALAPCDFGDVTLLAPPHRATTAPAAPLAPQTEPFLPLPTTFTVRHLWFLAWLLWFAVHLVRRARRPPGRRTG